jgi:hypothetical protein
LHSRSRRPTGHPARATRPLDWTGCLKARVLLAWEEKHSARCRARLLVLVHSGSELGVRYPALCLGSAHLPGRVTSDDESVGSAGERASRERELPDRSSSSYASTSRKPIDSVATSRKHKPRQAAARYRVARFRSACLTGCGWSGRSRSSTTACLAAPLNRLCIIDEPVAERARRTLTHQALRVFVHSPPRLERTRRYCLLSTRRHGIEAFWPPGESAKVRTGNLGVL